MPGSDSRRPGLRAAAALLLLMAAAGACRRGGGVPDAGAGGGYNLLLVTLDTTRADRLGAYGFAAAHTPTLDRLAREGVLFSACRTPVPLTLPAHSTLLTGREPPAHRVRNNGTYTLPADEATLAEAFQGAGYETRAMIAAFVLEGKFGLTRGFDVYDDVLEAGVEGSSFGSQIPADRAAAKALRWLENRDGDRPFFAWLHFYDPHQPFEPPQRWAERFPQDLYSGEIAFMDEQLGAVVEALRARGWLERTVLLLVGDHGEGFLEHGEYGHGLLCYEETLHVPLIAWQPSLFRGGRAVSRPVGLADIMPTLLEMYRLPAPAGVQGRSFARLLTGGGSEEPEPAYFESMQGMEEMGWAPLTGLLRGPYKYIRLPQPELYDLTADPGEKRNLYLQKNVLAREMDRLLSNRLRLITSQQEAARQSLSGSDRENLRALGYLASPAPAPDSGPPMDPKQGVTILARLARVERHLRSKEFAAAERILEELRAEGVDRTLPRFHDYLYEFHRAKRDMRACERTLREAIDRFPKIVRLRMLLATLLQGLGRPVEAEKLAREVIAADPLTTQAHVMLAQIAKRRSDKTTALAEMRQAGRLEPGNSRLQLELAGLEEELGEGGAARTTLLALLERDPDGAALDGEHLRQAAALLSRLGEARRATALLAGRSAQKPDDAATLTQLGLAHLDAGEGEAARRALERALQIDPRQPLALSGMGTLHLNSFRRERRPEQLQQAGDFYRRALEADPRLVTALNGLGVIRLYAGDLDGAIAAWREVQRIDPQFVNAYFNLAIAQLGAGGPADARRTLLELRRRCGSRLSPDENRQLDSLLRECGN